MSYGPKQVFTVAVASGTSTSSALFLGKGFTNLALKFPTMSTGAAVTLWGSTDGTTLARIQERVNTATVQYDFVTFPTAASGTWCYFASPPTPYIHFTTSATVTDGTAFIVAAQD